MNAIFVKSNSNQIPKLDTALSDFITDEEYLLKEIKSIHETIPLNKVKGHSAIKSRFKVIEIEFLSGHKISIETDQAYSFFRTTSP